MAACARPVAQVVLAASGEAPAVEVDLPAGELTWRPHEYVDAVLALSELNVLCGKAFDSLTADELEQVSFAAFTIVSAVIEERTRRESA